MKIQVIPAGGYASSAPEYSGLSVLERLLCFLFFERTHVSVAGSILAPGQLVTLPLQRHVIDVKARLQPIRRLFNQKEGADVVTVDIEQPSAKAEGFRAKALPPSAAEREICAKAHGFRPIRLRRAKASLENKHVGPESFLFLAYITEGKDMDYGKLLNRAWTIIWEHKFLILLGILVAFGSSSGSGLSSGSQSILRSEGEWQMPPKWRGMPFPPAEGMGMPALPVLIIVLLAGLALIIGLAVWVISTLARGALINGASQIDAGDRPSFGETFSAALQKG